MKITLDPYFCISRNVILFVLFFIFYSLFCVFRAITAVLLHCTHPNLNRVKIGLFVLFAKNTGFPCSILNTYQHGQNTEFFGLKYGSLYIDLNRLEKKFGCVFFAFRAVLNFSLGRIVPSRKISFWRFHVPRESSLWEIKNEQWYCNVQEQGVSFSIHFVLNHNQF